MRPLLSRLTARAADRTPERLERHLLRARSVLTADAPTIGLPAAARVLVLAPHPDDETLCCGGTAALYAAARATVTVVVATDGDAARVDLPPGELGRRRRAEVHDATAALGLPAPVLLGLQDGGLENALDELTDEIAAHLATGPDVVILPWFGDGHRDHVAVNRALAAAAPRVSGDPLVLGGETWTPAPITRLVDITDAIDRVRAATSAHGTAARSFDLEAMLALKRYRSIHGLRGRGWAEGFVAAPLSTYADLVARDAETSRA